MRYSLITILSAGVLLIGFQNCSRASFGSNSGSGGIQQALTPIDDGNGSKNPNDPGSTDPSRQPMSEGTGSQGIVNNGGDDGNKHSGDGTCDHGSSAGSYANDDHSKNNDNDNDDSQGDEQGQASNGDYVACILVDHGKSLKLGLITSQLGGAHSVAESVCVSKMECLTKVAKDFQVEGAYDRGYCQHNPNVTRLTDAQVDKLLAAQFPPSP